MYTARWVGINVFSGVGLILCVLVEQRVVHLTFRGGVVNGQVQ